MGRTPAVTRTPRVTRGGIEHAALTADLTRLRSDRAGRDSALRGRGIETATYPRARFALDGPVALSASERRLRAGLARRELELVRRAANWSRASGIEPPSVAGVVTVRDRGVLEVRLIATRA